MKIISGILFCLLSTFSFSQKKYDKIYKEVNGFTVVQIGDKYGYINDLDVEIVAPIYQDAFNFESAGLACVKLNDKFGWIDKEGKLVIPCEYDTRSDISEEGLIAVSQNGNYGYINTKGKKIGKFDYEKTWPFNDGAGPVKKNGLVGFVDEKGKVFIELQYETTYGFNNGYAGVQKNGKQGYINKNNEETVPIKFKSVSKPINNVYVKVMNDDSLYGIYSILGTEKVPVNNTVIYDFETNNVAVFIRNGKYGLFTSKWVEFLPPKYDKIYKYADNFMPTKLGGLYGFIDVANNKIIEPKYNSSKEFEIGVSVVSENGKVGMINTKLETIIESKYESYNARPDDKIFLWKNANQLWDMTDLNGKILLTGITALDDFNKDGIANFERGEESGTVSTKGVIVLKQKSVKVDKTNIAYAKSNLTPIGNLSQLYYFTNTDTLNYMDGKEKHLASLRDGKDIITLDTYADSSYKDGTSKYIGFRLSRYQFKNGKYELVSQSMKDTLQVSKYSRNSVGHDYNTFVKTSFGFLACGKDIIYAFDNDLNIIYKKHDDYVEYINAIQIPNTNMIALLTHVNGSRTTFGIRLIDYKTKISRYTPLKMRAPLQQYDMYCGENNKLLAIDSKYLFAALIGHDRNAGQYFVKLDLKSLMNSEEKIIWEKTFNTFGETMRISSVFLSNDGKLSGSLRYDDLKEISGYFSADFNATTQEEFQASLKLVGLKNENSLRPYRVIPIHGDRLAILARGKEQFGLNEFDVIAITDKQLNVIGQYRLKTPEEEYVAYDRAIERYSFYDWRRDVAVANQITCPAALFSTSILYKDYTNGTETFSVDEYISNQIWEVIDGDKTDELILQTGSSLIKVNLNKYEECDLRTTPFTWGKLMYQEGESKDGGSDPIVSNNTSNQNTSNKINNQTSNSGNTSTTNNKIEDYTGQVYFHFDSNNKSKGEKLYIHYGSNGSYKTSTSVGSDASIKCEAGKVYYSFTGEKKDMVLITEIKPSDCKKKFYSKDFVK